MNTIFTTLLAFRKIFEYNFEVLAFKRWFSIVFLSFFKRHCHIPMPSSSIIHMRKDSSFPIKNSWLFSDDFGILLVKVRVIRPVQIRELCDSFWPSCMNIRSFSDNGIWVILKIDNIIVSALTVTCWKIWPGSDSAFFCCIRLGVPRHRRRSLRCKSGSLKRNVISRNLITHSRIWTFHCSYLFCAAHWNFVSTGLEVVYSFYCVTVNVYVLNYVFFHKFYETPHWVDSGSVLLYSSESGCCLFYSWTVVVSSCHLL